LLISERKPLTNRPMEEKALRKKSPMEALFSNPDPLLRERGRNQSKDIREIVDLRGTSGKNRCALIPCPSVKHLRLTEAGGEESESPIIQGTPRLERRAGVSPGKKKTHSKPGPRRRRQRERGTTIGGHLKALGLKVNKRRRKEPLKVERNRNEKLFPWWKRKSKKTCGSEKGKTEERKAQQARTKATCPN